MKIDNFRIHNDIVRVIDFGMTMEYMKDGAHKALGRFGFQGTPYYGSISSLNKYTISRRDDIESLGYSIMQLIDAKKMPWYNCETKDELLLSKRNFIVDPDVPLEYKGIQKYIKSANALDYFLEPDYNEFEYYLIHMLDDFREAELETIANDIYDELIKKELFQYAECYS